MDQYQIYILYKCGAYLINTARGKICECNAIVAALESGKLAGYADDVWFPQPASVDHPWRTTMSDYVMHHMCDTNLSAQKLALYMDFRGG